MHNTSPLGQLYVGVHGDKVCLCGWAQPDTLYQEFGSVSKALNAVFTDSYHHIAADALSQLAEYFSGKRKVFDLPLKLVGTDFQQRVWCELCKIPYGTTITYGEQARRIGNFHAVRAVGQANGRNPIAIIVPCHRVIGSSGALIGYAGGMDRKAFLLDLEKGNR